VIFAINLLTSKPVRELHFGLFSSDVGLDRRIEIRQTDRRRCAMRNGASCRRTARAPMITEYRARTNGYSVSINMLTVLLLQTAG